MQYNVMYNNVINVWYEGGVTEDQNLYHVILRWKLGKRMSSISTVTFCKELWPKQSKNTIYMGPYGSPAKHVFKMASLAVTWMPSSNLWCTKSQRSGHVYHTVLSRKAYYSSQVNAVCVIAQPVSPLPCSTDIWLVLENMLQLETLISQGPVVFSSFSRSIGIIIHYSGLVVILVTVVRKNIRVSPRPGHDSLHPHLCWPLNVRHTICSPAVLTLDINK